MPKISILLSTYNGAKYLKEQLSSLNNQTYKNFKIIIRDDGSSDDTLQILQSYDVEIIETKENLGAKGSYEIVLEYGLSSPNTEYFMFCDQDDVWESDKVEKTIAKIKKMEKEYGNIPLLVHTNLEVVDEYLNTISKSMWEYEKINSNLNSLNRLLIQNTITGCTMMINRELAQKCLAIPKEAIMHDWWIGLVASEFGKITFLEESTIKYRQHGKNDTGTRKYSFEYIFNRFKKSNEINIDKNIIQARKFLEVYYSDLDKNTNKMLADFSSIKEKPYLIRIYILFKYDLFKCGFFRNLGLILKI